jgi:hypothetical protein
MSPAPIMAMELASGESKAAPVNGSLGVTPTPIGRPMLNWFGRITLPSGRLAPSELPRPLLKLIVGSVSKELEGGITMS